MNSVQEGFAKHQDPGRGRAEPGSLLEPGDWKRVELRGKTGWSEGAWEVAKSGGDRAGRGGTCTKRHFLLSKHSLPPAH